MTHDELIEKVAKAINGPFRPLPEGSPHTLEQLRDIRWTQINGRERNLCLASAKAAVSTIYAALLEPTEAMLKEAHEAENESSVHNYGSLPSATDYWDFMLNASPLGGGI